MNYTIYGSLYLENRLALLCNSEKCPNEKKNGFVIGLVQFRVYTQMYR